MNTREIAKAASDILLASHSKIFKRMVVTGSPLILPPGSDIPGQPENLSEYWLLVAPIRIGQHVNGMVEVWKASSQEFSARASGYLEFLMRMAELASAYPGFGATRDATDVGGHGEV